MTLKCLFYLLFHVISTFHQSDAFSMKMFPIDSPHLNILPHDSFTIKEREKYLADISLSRAYYAKKTGPKLGLDSVESIVSHVQTSYFVTKLSFGDPKEPFVSNMIIDTFSDHTWIQCAGCNPCFPLTDTFALDDAPSYLRMSLNDAKCIPKINFDGSCAFEASFGKGHTEGYLGKTKFIFDYSDDKGHWKKIFPNIALGCGIHNNNFTFTTGNETNVIAGVIGLAPGPRSFITQLDETIKGRFSYCISSHHDVNTLISFGDDAYIDGDDARTVQTIAMKPGARYHLYLAAIVVHGFRLHIDPTHFEPDTKNYTKGFFIDPGSPVTVLNNFTYMLVKSAIVDHFWQQYGWAPLHSNTTIYDLCYSNVTDASKGQVYPSVVFHFVGSTEATGEVEFRLPDENVFGKSELEEGFCLKMLPSDGPSIFGAVQQANHRFLFDVNAELLSFVPEKCRGITSK